MRNLPVAVLLTVAFNCAVAALLTLVGFGGTFLENLVYSQCIGLIILLTVDAGWRLFWRGGRPPAAPMIGLVLLGVLAGWLAGTALGAALLSHAWQPGRAGGAVLGITAAAGLVGTVFFWSRERGFELERQALEARMKLLQAQIEPHFLFNTLANLDALIGSEPARARAMLGHLNQYLRATLDAARRERATLGEEIALLRAYLEIVAIRMGPRLRFRLDCPEALAAFPLPPMLLQPLVENAIRHGLEPKSAGGEVTVAAREDGGMVKIEVADTGQGPGASKEPGTSVGLDHVRQRLAAAYHGRASLDYGGNFSGGVTVTLRIPA